MTMDPDLKAKWIEALRSGQYTQATGKLERKYSDGVVGNCCLGVLCRIEGLAPDYRDIGEGAFVGLFTFPLSDDVMVQDSAMPEPTWMEARGISTDFAGELASRNDQGFTFEDIANEIEERL